MAVESEPFNVRVLSACQNKLRIVPVDCAAADVASSTTKLAVCIVCQQREKWKQGVIESKMSEGRNLKEVRT